MWVEVPQQQGKRAEQKSLRVLAIHWSLMSRCSRRCLLTSLAHLSLATTALPATGTSPAPNGRR